MDKETASIHTEDNVDYIKFDTFDDSSSDSCDNGANIEKLRSKKKKWKKMEKVNAIGEMMDNLRADEVKLKEKEKEEIERNKDKPTIPKQSVIKDIKNKQYRSLMYKILKRRQIRAKEKLLKIEKKEAYLSGRAIDKKIPRTIETKREDDVTMTNESDEEQETEDLCDKYASYYAKEYEPKILLTAADRIHGRTMKFMKELSLTMPNATFKWRNSMGLKKMLEVATSKGFTDAIVVNEDRRQPSGLLIYHLPDGPCAMFRLLNVQACKNLKLKTRELLGYRPELILNNFKTRLGRTVARMLGALYHYQPEFKGRSVCTFHNQRDYIFFRHHRYQFKNTEKVALKELGPRFTLRLEWLREGDLESDFEWTLKRHEMETSRTRFFL